MATLNQFRHLWTEYQKLENWAASTDPISKKKKFKIETNSFPNETTTPSDELNDGRTASNVEEKSISIGGLIYPSTAPFIQRGLRVEIIVPVSYPKVPPTVYMRMGIRHPNIEKNGKSIFDKLIYFSMLFQNK